MNISESTQILTDTGIGASIGAAFTGAASVITNSLVFLKEGLLLVASLLPFNQGSVM